MPKAKPENLHRLVRRHIATMSDGHRVLFPPPIPGLGIDLVCGQCGNVAQVVAVEPEVYSRCLTWECQFSYRAGLTPITAEIEGWRHLGVYPTHDVEVRTAPSKSHKLKGEPTPGTPAWHAKHPQHQRTLREISGRTY